MRIGYVRVSTVEQNEARQVKALEKHDIEKWFIEKVSGKDTNREQLQLMLDFAREGDCIYIHDFSRLARSTRDLLDIIDTLNRKGVSLFSDKENLDSTTPTGQLMITMIGAINQFERQNLLDRQAEGIAVAKANGVYKGRKPVQIDDTIFNREYDRYMRREITKTELAKVLKISRPTLDKMIQEKKAG